MMSRKEWWDSLNWAQQITAHGLANIGYELAFIRNQSDGKMAVFLLDQSIITVDHEGEADMSPQIHLR